VCVCGCVGVGVWYTHTYSLTHTILETDYTRTVARNVASALMQRASSRFVVVFVRSQQRLLRWFVDACPFAR